jgi:glycolate oxidase
MADVLTALSTLLGSGRVLSGDAALPYARDESDVGARTPLAAIEARTAEEVEAIVRVCREHRTPVIARGAGTGKVGGALAEQGGIVLSLARLATIKEIHKEDLVAVVEPGVITGELQRQVEAQGLFYPPDPNSLETCSIGGNIAHNAGGPRAARYGVTRDYVLGLEAVLGTGERIRTGHRSIKGVAGYDLTALLVGSEGTLGIVTEATLQLLPLPPHLETALLLFTGADGERRALQAVGSILGAGLLPRCCEFLDTSAIQAVAPRAPFAIPATASACLIVEVDGTPEGCERDLQTIQQAGEQNGASDIVLARDESERRRVWETRRLISPSLRAMRPQKISEDVAVPRSRILEMVAEVRKIGAAHGLQTAAYGHVGDGNLHVNLLFESREDTQRVESAIADVMRASVRLGGTITGEHGVGLAKRGFLALEQSPAAIAAQRRIKAALDPDGILNPGKIFPPV